MKPRVYQSPEEFLKTAPQTGKSVIETDKIMLTGHMYVTTGVDYVYYTYSPQPLSLPKGIEVVRAISVEF